ncbi:acyltransferase family protein [Escherichia coli]|uniref:acyltransferase family protein n=1 Tax=Escherichia coli TaxID=562 RepID=UPI00197FC243|nr:acyltransferase [Escherichia coli]QSF77842.1 acyltransferase [Escherichia coli]
MKDRDVKIDFLKALATLLVVVGHCIQFSDIDFDNNLLFRVIYSFHMPLFMCIAGFLFVEKDKVINELVKKAKLLLVPFFSWSVVSYFLMNGSGSNLDGLTKHITSVIANPALGLWFLPTLFVCFLVFYILPRKDKELYVMAVILALSVMVKVIDFLSFDILKLVAWQMPFFLSGYLIRKYELISVFRRKEVFFASFFIFVIFVSQWQRTSTTNLFGYPLDGGMIAFASNMIVRYVCALSAIVVLFGINIRISNGIMLGVLLFLSNNSLSVYAVQTVILGMIIGMMGEFTQNQAIVAISSFSFSVIAIVIIVSAINKIKFVRVILFGR